MNHIEEDTFYLGQYFKRTVRRGIQHLNKCTL